MGNGTFQLSRIPALLLVLALAGAGLALTFGGVRAQGSNCPAGTLDLGYLAGSQPYAGRVCKNAGDPTIDIVPDYLAPCGSRIAITSTADNWYFVPPSHWISWTNEINLSFLLNSAPITSSFVISSLQAPSYTVWAPALAGGYSVASAGDWVRVDMTATGNYTGFASTAFRLTNAAALSYSVSSLRLWDSSRAMEYHCKPQDVLFELATPYASFSLPAGFIPTPFPVPPLPATNTITGTVQLDPFWDLSIYTNIISAYMSLWGLSGIQTLLSIGIWLVTIMAVLVVVQTIGKSRSAANNASDDQNG